MQESTICSQSCGQIVELLHNEACSLLIMEQTSRKTLTLTIDFMGSSFGLFALDYKIDQPVRIRSILA